VILSKTRGRRSTSDIKVRSTIIELLGFAAGTLTTISFVPQVWHSWSTRDLSGISLRMYSLFVGGTLLWLIYGIYVGSWPISIANAITFSLASVVLRLKLVHRRAVGAP
jgi:MtN3 and saliva related transmembrane protein